MSILSAMFTQKGEGIQLEKKQSIISKKNMYLIILLVLIILYMVSDVFKSFSSQIMMLFTSNGSAFTIGYLNSFGFMRPIVAIALMIVQALIFPFKYETMIFANTTVFGEMLGASVSIIGRIIGAYICYDIGKTLWPSTITSSICKINRRKLKMNNFTQSNLVNVLIRLLPINFDLMSYFGGIMRINFKKYMINSIIWITGTTVLYAIKNGYFSHAYEISAIYIRLILSFIVLIVIVKRYKKDRKV